jgi:hypothetical protein
MRKLLMLGKESAAAVNEEEAVSCRSQRFSLQRLG